jgi:hypothetical protein
LAAVLLVGKTGIQPLNQIAVEQPQPGADKVCCNAPATAATAPTTTPPATAPAWPPSTAPSQGPPPSPRSC